MANARPTSPCDMLVLARDISDSVQVGGLKTVAAAVALDSATGLILGSGMAADARGAVHDLLKTVSAAANEPRLLCPPELLGMVRAGLPAPWRKAEIAAVLPGAEVEDLFDSLVGHLAGRAQPNDLPSPADWSMLFRQARAFVEAAPWRRLADDVHLQMDLRLGGALVQRIGIILGNGGVTYGFALYPGDAEPAGRAARFNLMAPPPGTLVMTLDPASRLPAYLAAKARRYQWPDSLPLLPVFLVWTGGGAADLSSDQVGLLAMALAAALAGADKHRERTTTGDMILSGGRSGHYSVAVNAPGHDSESDERMGPTIDRALQAFLDDYRSRRSARTARTYESVIDLLRACLNSYGYQYLSEAEHDAFQAAYAAGDEQAFCHLFGAAKIAESVGEFLGYFMIRKVAASGELLRASGTVLDKLAAWLADRGELSPDVAHEVQRRARAAARDLPRAARLAEILFDTVELAPRVDVDRLDDADYIEDELTISRVEPGRVWFEDDIGPVKVPKAASELARAGWTVSVGLGRVRGQWRIVEVGGVYP